MTIDDPLDFVGAPELGVAFAIVFGAFLVFGRLITTVGPPPGDPKPLRLEMPLTKKKAGDLIETWKKRGQIDAMRKWVLADFPWLVAYSLSIAAAGSLAGRAAESAFHSGDARTVGAVFVYAGWIAGALDVLENVCMLGMLGGHVSQPVPGLTTLFAGLKWLIAAIAAIGALGLLISSAVAAVT